MMPPLSSFHDSSHFCHTGPQPANVWCFVEILIRVIGDADYLYARCEVQSTGFD